MARYGRYRFRKPAGPAGTPLLFDISFTGIPVDQYQKLGGVTPTWDKTQPTDSQRYIGTSGDIIRPNLASVHADWPEGDRIIDAANRSGGGGGKGFRHTIGTGQTGGGNIVLWPWASLTSPMREFWFQWWQRYSLGLEPETGGNPWFHYSKDIDFNDQGPGAAGEGRITVGQSQGSAGSGGRWGAVVYTGGGRNLTPNISNLTWAMQNGGSGLGAEIWHKYQVHVQVGDGTNGVFEAWYDNTLVCQHTDVDFSGNDATTFAGYMAINLSTNQNNLLGPGYSDYDDIKLSVVGYITQD